ncbi:MAG: nucleotidyl transferase AbiEii/AbiGii toxin family protein [Candidatus Cryosericum sp.]
MHPECVEEKARLLMSRVGPTLGMHGAVLAGGTALALHLGHRISGDLEFFTQQAFKPSVILEELRGLAGVLEPMAMGGDAMIVQADGARLLLTQDPVSFPEPTTRLNGCDVAGVVDIAAMKLVAVRQRGTRSDFVDLYTVLQTVPFRRVARNALERYGADALEPLVIGKGLVWFEDADPQEDPLYVGAPVAWDHIKTFFRSSVRQFVFDLDVEEKSRGSG